METSPSNYLQRAIHETSLNNMYKQERHDQKRSLLLSGSGSSEMHFPTHPGSMDRRSTQGSVQYTVPSLQPFDSSQNDSSQNGTGSTQITISDLERSDMHDNYSGQVRHNSNSLCSCSKCGTSFSFRPMRGRSYISDMDAPLLPSSGTSESTNSGEDTPDSAVSLNSGRSVYNALYRKQSPSKAGKNTQMVSAIYSSKGGLSKSSPRDGLHKDSEGQVML